MRTKKTCSLPKKYWCSLLDSTRKWIPAINEFAFKKPTIIFVKQSASGMPCTRSILNSYFVEKKRFIISSLRQTIECSSKTYYFFHRTHLFSSCTFINVVWIMKQLSQLQAPLQQFASNCYCSTMWIHYLQEFWYNVVSVFVRILG